MCLILDIFGDFRPNLLWSLQDGNSGLAFHVEKAYIPSKECISEEQILNTRHFFKKTNYSTCIIKRSEVGHVSSEPDFLLVICFVSAFGRF